MHHADPNATTLRLQTLRRLLRRERPVRVFEATTSIGEVRWELADTHGIAAIVDAAGVLSGTATLDDLAGGAPDCSVSDVMERTAPTALPELEVEAAWQLLQQRHADRVVVVSPSGELLGILTIADLDAARQS